MERLEDVLCPSSGLRPGMGIPQPKVSALLRDDSRYIESDLVERGNIEKIERAGCKGVAKGSLYATYRLAQKGEYFRTRDECSITF